jgi:hypothetical protein
MHLLLDPYFENVYSTNNVFTSMGVSVDPKFDYLINYYMENLEIFELQNQQSINGLKYVHNTFGWSVIEYQNIYDILNINDIDFAQRETLDQLYKLMFKMMSNVIDKFYLSENDIKKDREIQNWFYHLNKNIPKFPNKLTIKSLKYIITNIAFNSSVRHAQSHVNFYRLYNLYDYPSRQTYTETFLKDMETNKIIAVTDLYKTFGHLLKDISSTLYAAIPLNLLGYGMKNYFKQKDVQDIIDNFTYELESYKKTVDRNIYTEYVFRLSKSNTI